ncbi:MAG: M28 family peptidase [Duncaniella sp.]|nr:M28 family peptidase [Duncaniella sp.]
MNCNQFLSLICVAGVMLSASSCKCSSSSDADVSDATVEIKEQAVFDADTAFSYIARQVAMGPRVAGSRANEMCSQMIIEELKRNGADTVTVQAGDVRAYTGEILPIKNVMASYNSSSPKRILLVAHYDTRPWADSDPVEENRIHPIPGANDGGSGVGVLLEIARQLGKHAPGIGVDMLFVDAEDYGQSGGFSNHDNSWALGTQYWVDHIPYAQDSLPSYAILLDMVGGIGAKFHREFFSNRYSPQIVDRVWSIASASGYGDRFVNLNGGSVIDDHVFINKAGIPAIDIIESKHDATGTFSPTWHTMNDDMDNIDRSTLKAVGQTVLNVIYNEKP